MNSIRNPAPFWLTIILSLSLTGPIQSQESIDPGIGDPYSLEKCILSDEKLDDEHDIFEAGGREIRVCCSDCMNRFPEEAYFRIGEINTRLVEQQRSLYPLAKCIVTGKPLSEAAIDHIFRNRLFRLASVEAIAELEKNPAKFFGELDLAVIESQRDDYPLDSCVVSGQALSGTAIDHVIANQLIRLASFDQLIAFNKNPGKYLADIRAAAAAKK